jgi:hypothetical protein
MEGERVLTIHHLLLFQIYISTEINLFCYREAEEDSDDNSDEDGGSAEENKEEVIKETPKQSEETEFQRRQKELIQK